MTTTGTRAAAVARLDVTAGPRSWSLPEAGEPRSVTAQRAAEWMPYDVDERFVALDVAFALIGEGDRERAREVLHDDDVRDALTQLADRVLGPGRLDDGDHLRSRALMRVVFEDVAAAARLAAEDHPDLLPRARELDLEARLRGADDGLQVVIGKEMDEGGVAGHLGGGGSGGRWPVDLAMVPARLLVWSGAARGELAGTWCQDEGELRVTAELRGTADLHRDPGRPLRCFVLTTGGEVHQAPAVVREGRLEAHVPTGSVLEIEAVGLCASSGEVPEALRRVRSGEATATRWLVETWAQEQVARALLSLPEDPGSATDLASWLTLHPRVATKNAQAELERARRLALRRNSAPEQAVAAATARHHLRLLEDASPRPSWARNIDLVGPDRPLAAALMMVLEGKRHA